MTNCLPLTKFGAILINIDSYDRVNYLILSIYLSYIYLA